MEKLYKSAVFTLVVITIIFPLCSYAQDAPAAPPAQTPDVVDPAPDFPDYIVTPREDLNNFGLSTMSEAEDIDYRDGVGTLGTTEQRQSNLEVNAELKKRKMEREKAKQKSKEAQNKPSTGESSKTSSEPPSLEAVGGSAFKPGVKRGLFMWRDENGVLHATNDLGHVPIEYQMQAIENSGGSFNLKKADPKSK